MTKRANITMRGEGKARRARTRRAEMLVEALEARVLLSAALSWVSGPGNLAIAPDHSVWYADGRNLTRQGDDGAIATFAIPLGSNNAIRRVSSDIAFTSDSSAWFIATDISGKHLERMTAQGVLTELLPGAVGNAWDVTVSGDGRVWFAKGNDTVGVLSADGSPLANYAVPGLTAFSDITTGPDGNVWFAGDRIGGGVVGTISATGAVTTYALTANPSDIAVASDGTMVVGGNDGVWHVTTGGAVSRVTLAGTTALELTAGDNGDVWFVDYRNPLSPISLLSADGSLRQYAVPGAANVKVSSLVVVGGSVRYTAMTANGTGFTGSLHLAQDLLPTALQIKPQIYTPFSGVVAAFEDPLGSPEGAAQYAATIHWGDGSVSTGTVARNDSGIYQVAGTHNYQSVAWKDLLVSVVDGATGRTVNIASKAYVLPATNSGSLTGIDPGAETLLITAGPTLTVSGNTATGAVGSFVDLQPATGMQVYYGAVIHWGDGSTSSGSIVAKSGGFDVAGSHTYATSGDFGVSVTVQRYTFTLPPIKTEVLTDFAFRPTEVVTNTSGSSAYVLSVSSAGVTVSRSTYSGGLVFNNAFQGNSTLVVDSYSFSSGSTVTLQQLFQAGTVKIGTPNGSKGDTSHPDGPPSGPANGPGEGGPEHHPALVITSQAATNVPVAPRNEPSATIGLAGAALAGGRSRESARLADTGYGLMPREPRPGNEDPGVFQGELAVGDGAPVHQESTGDGTDSYASDGGERGALTVRPIVVERAAGATAGTRVGAEIVSVPAAPAAGGEEDSLAVIPTVAAGAAAEELPAGVEQQARTVSAAQHEPADATEEFSGATLEVKALAAAAEMPVSTAGVTRWWKVLAVLGIGAVLQGWYWRRVIQARRRRWM